MKQSAAIERQREITIEQVHWFGLVVVPIYLKWLRGTIYGVKMPLNSLKTWEADVSK